MRGNLHRKKYKDISAQFSRHVFVIFQYLNNSMGSGNWFFETLRMQNQKYI